MTAIAAGAYHCLALKGGRVSAGVTKVPVPVEAESGVTAIAAGSSLSGVEGRPGHRVGGRRGEGNVPVEAQSGVTAIAAGGKHWLALKDGKVIDWGVPGTGTRAPCRSRPSRG